MGFLTILNLCPKPISWHRIFFDVLAEGFCHLEANWNSKQFSLQMLWGDLLQIMDVIYFWPCIFFPKRELIKWLNICALYRLAKQLASNKAMISNYYCFFFPKKTIIRQIFPRFKYVVFQSWHHMLLQFWVFSSNITVIKLMFFTWNEWIKAIIVSLSFFFYSLHPWWGRFLMSPSSQWSWPQPSNTLTHRFT